MTGSGKAYETETVIIATGASARRLGLESEKALYGKGVSACATCDGFFFKGKEVAVVGGGDSAMEEATFLTKFATKVTILNRTDRYKASVPLLERAKANPKIAFVENVEVAEILGVDVGHVTGVKLKDAKTGEISELKLDGVFAAIGHVPNTDFLKEWLECDKVGYVVVKGPGDVTTKYEGVFVAGDVMDRRYRQAVTASATGCMAALEAERLLTHRSFGATQ
jgi:thioredoxin reductase (NADPH)